MSPVLTPADRVVTLAAGGDPGLDQRCEYMSHWFLTPVRLFLSPKTIDFHLGRVDRKLDIHSRAELATLVARGVLDDGAILGADD